MLANILYAEELVAIVYQEQRLEKIEIEIFLAAENKIWKSGFLLQLPHLGCL